MAEARKWKQLVEGYVVINRLKPSTPLTKARLNLVRHSSFECDFDGLVSGFKHCIDGLVVAGVIKNDRMGNIGQPNYKWMRSSPGKGFVTIEVEEIE